MAFLPSMLILGSLYLLSVVAAESGRFVVLPAGIAVLMTGILLRRVSQTRSVRRPAERARRGRALPPRPLASRPR